MLRLVLLVACVALLAVSVSAGTCTDCETTFNTCSENNNVKTCECTGQLRTCKINVGSTCCAAGSTDDYCAAACDANCYGSTDCSWPPVQVGCPTNTENACTTQYNNCKSGTSVSECGCERNYRNCLLGFECGYSQARSASCTTACTGVSPTPECGAVELVPTPTTQSPSPCPVGKFGADCSCNSDLRGFGGACSSGTWTFSSTVTVDNDRVFEVGSDDVVITGNIAVTNGSSIVFIIGANDASSGSLDVSGSANIQGSLIVEIQDTTTGAQKNVTYIEYGSEHANNNPRVTVPQLSSGVCFTSLSTNVTAAGVTLTYTLNTSGSSACLGPQTPATPTAASTPISAPVPPPAPGNTDDATKVVASMLVVVAAVLSVFM